MSFQGERITATIGAYAGGRLVLHHLSGRIPFKCRSCGFPKVDYRVAVLDNVDADLVCIDCLGPLAEQLAR